MPEISRLFTILVSHLNFFRSHSRVFSIEAELESSSYSNDCTKNTHEKPVIRIEYTSHKLRKIKINPMHTTLHIHSPKGIRIICMTKIKRLGCYVGSNTLVTCGLSPRINNIVNNEHF